MQMFIEPFILKHLNIEKIQELENAFNKIKWVENSSHWVDYFYSRFALVGAGDNQINNLLKEYRQRV